MVLELWGRNLAPEPWCGAERIPKDPLPFEICGVRVLIGSRPAELMYVSSGQINLKIPADLLAEGSAPFQVCVASVCSAPFPMRFSAHTALLKLAGPASVHMPVWIAIDAPSPYVVAYPCDESPWSFEGYEFEVRRNGRPLAALRPPDGSAPRIGATGRRCTGPTLRSALPLHLLYRFDESGVYSVRLTASKEGRTLYQSDWTDIEIEPFSQEKRDEWLRSLEGQASRRDVYDVVSSLLAWPDEKALALLLKVIPENIQGCVNYDCVRLSFGKAALAGFDAGLLRRDIPADRLRQLCPPTGGCR
jgi:hypothetical protein